jgi:hypothetical protein
MIKCMDPASLMDLSIYQERLRCDTKTSTFRTRTQILKMEHAKNTQEQQGQHQHSIMSHQELNRDWRRDEDVQYRRKIREHM